MRGEGEGDLKVDCWVETKVESGDGGKFYCYRTGIEQGLSSNASARMVFSSFGRMVSYGCMVSYGRMVS